MTLQEQFPRGAYESMQHWAGRLHRNQRRLGARASILRLKLALRCDSYEVEEALGALWCSASGLSFQLEELPLHEDQIPPGR